MVEDGKDTVRAVERALDILQSFDRETAGMSVVELQKRTRLSRPTLYRLLATLTARGFIRTEGDPQRFGLGPEIARLADVWAMHVDIAQLARPILQGLWQETAETVALFSLRGGTLSCLTELASRQPLSISRGVGPLAQHACQGASGKVIMANLPSREINDLMTSLPKGVEPSALRASLDTIRKKGVAVSLGEVIVGAVAIAAPVFDSSGRVAASLALFGPQARIDRPTMNEYRDLIRSAARRLSDQLGYRSEGDLVSQNAIVGAGSKDSGLFPEAGTRLSARRLAKGSSQPTLRDKKIAKNAL